MIEISQTPELRRWLGDERRAGHRIAFVPTMGALHEGHLTLVDEARRRADLVVMSIFVNPLQFAPQEDLSRYPRDLARDRALASGRGVDLLFVPSVETMYPPGSDTRVVPGPASERWEGAVRPGHFAGVLTVVTKLFHLVAPDLACFGQKDIQQFVLIRKMVRDLDLPIELVMVPTARDADGLALSSRNAYLSAAERRTALALPAALDAAVAAWKGGERSGKRLEVIVGERLARSEGIVADYIAVVEPEGLTPAGTAGAGTIIAIAARVGTTRLIDNVILG
ncbi:MAG TPA: pantoate--beta-alanine ligase [Gemmatimonadales bacterium]|nr:pantoate--beta-alanine ligase [Gemmatimonadales bacterium]